MTDYRALLQQTTEYALEWLATLEERKVPAQKSVADLAPAFGGPLPEGPTDPSTAVAELAAAAAGGLVAIPSGRFFGFVIGGTLPAALAADWLTSAWDQNAGLRLLTPAHTAADDAVQEWLLDLLGLPATAAVGLVTGGTMANFTGLAAGRDAVLRKAGWDVAERGIQGAPAIRVLVGAERHDTVDLALRYLGLGRPEPVGVDDQGRIRPGALAAALAAGSGPTLVALQAGNVHSGAFDPFEECIALAHGHEAWVHVDGAFGLWAAATPGRRHLIAGVGAADSWATDAHKTLNVPYDCGVAIVADQAALVASMGEHGDYLVIDGVEPEPLDKVPEFSRRARAFPVWAALRSLGRSGVADMVERMCTQARQLADGIADLPGAEVVNDVVFTQVCVSFGDDARTREVVDRLLADGTVWMTGSTWHGRAVMRISVSNWSTSEDDVRRAIDAVRRAAAEPNALRRASRPHGNRRLPASGRGSSVGRPQPDRAAALPEAVPDRESTRRRCRQQTSGRTSRCRRRDPSRRPARQLPTCRPPARCRQARSSRRSRC